MSTKHKSTNHHEYDLYEDVEKIKAALMDAGNDVRGKAGEILSDSITNVKEKSDLVKDSVTNYTSEKPLQSLGIALLVGVAIGYLIHK